VGVVDFSLIVAVVEEDGEWRILLLMKYDPWTSRLSFDVVSLRLLMFEKEVFTIGEVSRVLNGDARFKPLRIRRASGLAVREGLAMGERSVWNIGFLRSRSMLGDRMFMFMLFLTIAASGCRGLA